MSARAVQQFMARCVVEPAFLDLAATELDAALSEFELTPEERLDFARLDIESVRTFAGLVTKVQNNGLWQTFPDTRRLVDHYELDLELFADYRVQHQEDRGSAYVYQTDRTRHFAAFFPAWVEARGRDRYPGLLDVFHHERLWLEQRLALSDPIPFPGPAALNLVSAADEVFDELVPQARGMVLVEFFDFNPADVVHAVRSQSPDLRGLSPYPRHLAYWGDRDAMRMRIFEVDDPTRLLLAAIDGVKPVHALCASASMREVVREMAAAGVLTLSLAGV